MPNNHAMKAYRAHAG